MTGTATSGFETLVDDQERDYDLVVIDSGSAALAALIHAADSSRRVALVESNLVGGTCVNAWVGCRPRSCSPRPTFSIAQDTIRSPTSTPTPAALISM